MGEKKKKQTNSRSSTDTAREIQVDLIASVMKMIPQIPSHITICPSQDYIALWAGNRVSRFFDDGGTAPLNLTFSDI